MIVMEEERRCVVQVNMKKIIFTYLKNNIRTNDNEECVTKW